MLNIAGLPKDETRASIVASMLSVCPSGAVTAATVLAQGHLLGSAHAVSNTMTVAGAEIFLGARPVHAVTYFIGITGICTLAYIAGCVGTVLIFIQLI
jgi:uncharacterized MAPEG superfamily protein